MWSHQDSTHSGLRNPRKSCARIRRFWVICPQLVDQDPPGREESHEELDLSSPRWKDRLGPDKDPSPGPGIFEMVACLEGAAREREGPLPSPHSSGSQGRGRQKPGMLARHRCSSDLFPLDVFPVNRNCRALSAPAARDSVSPAAFGSLAFCWESKPFSSFLMALFPPRAPNPGSRNSSELNAGSLRACVGTTLAIGIFL